MIFQFGEFGAFWRKPVTVAVHFSSAAGVQPGGPVEMNGVTIGSVRNVSIDRKRGGARVIVDLEPKFDIRTDARPRLVESMFGETTVEFTAGGRGRPVRTGDRLDGDLPVDPLQMVAKLDEQLRQTMASFEFESEQTSAQKNLDEMEAELAQATADGETAEIERIEKWLSLVHI